MKRLLLVLIALVGLAAGCSHMPGVVKDVNWDKDGNLIVRKCDERHNWVWMFLVWEESNCREEIRKL